MGSPWNVQAQTTDRAGIEGKVVDQGGGVLPGVTATIESPALLGGTRTTATDAEGRYRFAALPAGEYHLKLELSGFTPVARTVLLSTGFVATINESMKVGTMTETVDVSRESPVVDIRTTGVTTNLGKEALEQLPTSRSMWQIMALAPGIRVNGVDVGGGAVGTQQGYSNYGTSAGGNKPSLDGVDTREDAGGAGFYYDYGAFQEVQIKAAGSDSEMAVPGTQFVGVLKSGGDKFSGSGYFGWETPKLQSDNVTDALRARGVSTGEPLKRYHDANVDLGGPIVKNRVWFYGSYRHQLIESGLVGYLESPGADNKVGTGDDVPGNYLVTLENMTGKVTGQINAAHRLSAFVQSQTKDYPQRNADAFHFKESTWHQVFKPLAAKVDWSWTASNRTYVNAFVGLWKYKTEGLNWTEAAPAFDSVTLMFSGRFLKTPYDAGRKRLQYNASVSHFVPDLWGGSHDLKLGAEMTDENRTENVEATSGGSDYQLRFQNGVPNQVVLYNYPYHTLGKMATQSAYVRDAWRFGDRATLNLGLRWERYDVNIPQQSKPAGRFYPAADFAATDVVQWNNWAPRIGFALPLGSKNSTVVKATYGYYNFATQGNYADTYNPNSTANTTYRWNDLNGNRDFNDGELGTFVTATGASASRINPDLKQPKTHEATASIETRIASNFSARASYVYRRETDRFQNVNVLRPYDAFSVAIANRDPGPDGVVGTADDGGPITVYDYSAAFAGSAFVRNVDVTTAGFDNSYQSFEVAAQKRMSNKWQLVTSFLATNVDEWRAGDGAGISENPNQDYFPKAKYWEWSFKLAGSYDLPWKMQVAGTFTSQSGSVWGRDARFTAPRIASVIIFMEDRAANRLPTQNILNVRLEKRQKIGPGTASFQLDVFNVTNTNAETGITTRSGASFGQITGIIPPRIARLGVSYKF